MRWGDAPDPPDRHRPPVSYACVRAVAVTKVRGEKYEALALAAWNVSALNNPEAKPLSVGSKAATRRRAQGELRLEPTSRVVGVMMLR